MEEIDAGLSLEGYTTSTGTPWPAKNDGRVVVRALLRGGLRPESRDHRIMAYAAQWEAKMMSPTAAQQQRAGPSASANATALALVTATADANALAITSSHAAAAASPVRAGVRVRVRLGFLTLTLTPTLTLTRPTPQQAVRHKWATPTTIP